MADLDETNVLQLMTFFCPVIIQLSLLDLKLSEFVPIHDSQIRDVLFSLRDTQGDGCGYVCVCVY